MLTINSRINIVFILNDYEFLQNLVRPNNINLFARGFSSHICHPVDLYTHGHLAGGQRARFLYTEPSRKEWEVV